MYVRQSQIKPKRTMVHGTMPPTTLLSTPQSRENLSLKPPFCSKMVRLQTAYVPSMLIWALQVPPSMFTVSYLSQHLTQVALPISCSSSMDSQLENLYTHLLGSPEDISSTSSYTATTPFLKDSIHLLFRMENLADPRPSLSYYWIISYIQGKALLLPRDLI